MDHDPARAEKSGPMEKRELPMVGAPKEQDLQETIVAPLDYSPRKSSEVLELDMGDGLILYNHEADLVHHLNPSAALIWHICDGEASVAQLSQEIADEYRLSPEEVQPQIATVIGELDALGLVENAGVGSDGPA